MQYACTECGSPAVTLPDRLDPNALVHCRDCRNPVATWAVFKYMTTQTILAETKTVGAEVNSLSYDPLDNDLLRALAGRL
jgi:hypothetical protein